MPRRRGGGAVRAGAGTGRRKAAATAATPYAHPAPSRRRRSVADALARRRADLAPAGGGAPYGLWRSRIDRPRDGAMFVTRWSAPVTPPRAGATRS
jgi:hypothetical protein